MRNHQPVGKDGPVKHLLRPVTVVMLVGMLLGCTPASLESPSPEASTLVVTPTPSPVWTEDEQAAIDAVQAYLSVWTEVTQALPDADLSRIREVASDPAANHALSQWAQWGQQGWHLVGAPAFTPDFVTLGMLDSQGQRYHVYGCYVITGAYLSDAQGNQVGDRGVDRGPSMYLVLRTSSDRYLVLEDNSEEGTC